MYDKTVHYKGQKAVSGDLFTCLYSIEIFFSKFNLVLGYEEECKMCGTVFKNIKVFISIFSISIIFTIYSTHSYNKM